MINCQRAPSSEHQVSNSTLILCLTLGKSRFSVMQEKKKKTILVLINLIFWNSVLLKNTNHFVSTLCFYPPLSKHILFSSLPSEHFP